MKNKMYKTHPFLLVTEFIFCNNPKANAKMWLGVCCGNQGDANFQAGLQKSYLLLYYSIKLITT